MKVESKLLTLGQHGDISGRIYALKHLLELVEETECVATLLLHDLVDHLRVELDLQVAQRWLELFKVRHRCLDWELVPLASR